jgi:phosphoribosyl-ATP pyrophosphohydrolase
MKKIVKLTEDDLTRIVKRVIEEQENEMSEEEIIKLLIDTAEDTPTEDYDDVYDWMNVIFSQVEFMLEDVYDDVDDLREKYDYVLMNMWGREWWGID